MESDLSLGEQSSKNSSEDKASADACLRHVPRAQLAYASCLEGIYGSSAFLEYQALQEAGKLEQNVPELSAVHTDGRREMENGDEVTDPAFDPANTGK